MSETDPDSDTDHEPNADAEIDVDVDTEYIRKEGLSPDDVLDRETAEPKFEPYWPDFWDDHPEERPGEDVELEDGTLSWTYEGFDVELESYETTHWKAVIDIPKPYGKYYPRPVDLKCSPKPEYGFVDEVEMNDYAAAQATIVIQENHQPTFEVNRFIDHVIERHEGGERFEAEITAKLQTARENDPEGEQPDYSLPTDE